MFGGLNFGGNILRKINTDHAKSRIPSMLLIRYYCFQIFVFPRIANHIVRPK